MFNWKEKVESGERVAIHEPGEWENEEGVEGWYAISDMEGIKAYVGNEDLASLVTASPKLLEALEHALDRLNAIPHNYKDTNFKLIADAITQVKGR